LKRAAPVLARDPASELSAVLVHGPEGHADQHAGLDDVVDDIARTGVEAFLAGDDVARRDAHAAGEEILHRVGHRGGRARMPRRVFREIRGDGQRFPELILLDFGVTVRIPGGSR
jgi:hypothetical protein